MKESQLGAWVSKEAALVLCWGCQEAGTQAPRLPCQDSGTCQVSPESPKRLGVPCGEAGGLLASLTPQEHPGQACWGQQPAPPGSGLTAPMQEGLGPVEPCAGILVAAPAPLQRLRPHCTGTSCERSFFCSEPGSELV